MTETELSYKDQRLQEAGITPEFNATTVQEPELLGDVHDQNFIHHVKDAHWFTSTPEDNMRILFKTLDNQVMKVKKGDNKWATPFERIRLSPGQIQLNKELTGKSGKYRQPSGTGTQIWHSQGIINTYGSQEQIKTLYLVEGEMKAFVAWMESVKQSTDKKNQDARAPKELPIMAVTGIFNFYGPEKTLHPDIVEYVRVCRPENIVFIMDSDLYQPSAFDPMQPGKDIGGRIKNFYKAVVEFREVAKAYAKDLYLAHPQEYLLESGVKGLDDLILDQGPRTVLKELYKMGAERVRFSLFSMMNISDASRGDLLKMFNLKLYKGVPRDFYNKFIETLQAHEFNFLGGHYKVNEDGDLAIVKHPESELYIRVEGKYFKIITVPDAYGNMSRKIVNWPKAEIKDDYTKRTPNFFETLAKYDAFCNVPENDPAKYRAVIDNCYNLYYPIDHELKQGSWKTYEKYLRHVFRDQYDIALDWFHILYTKPTQKLPVICLVSKEKNTGKSTALDMGKILLQENAITIGNQELTGQFNNDYASKLLIGIDEGFIDKKLVVERLKSMVTSRHINMDTKQISRQAISFFAKMIITSNNEDDFLRIDDDESRFWVVKVPKLEGKTDPKILDKFEAEAASFLYYLKHTHKVKYPHVERLWFDPTIYETEAAQKLKRKSRSTAYKTIETWITSEFIKYNDNHNQIKPNGKPLVFDQLHYSLSDICMALYGNEVRARNEMFYIKSVLVDQAKLVAPTKAIRRSVPVLDPEAPESSPRYQYSSGEGLRQRWWTFNIEDWFDDQELITLTGKDKAHFKQWRELSKDFQEDQEDLPF